MKTRPIIFALLLLQATILAQGPCSQQEASQRPGAWGKNADDLAMADSTFPKVQYASVLKKADQAIVLLKQAVPSLTGVEARPYRSIRGQPYVANGPVPFALNVPIFDYHCIPQTSGDPNLRGKIKLSGETGTWIYFYFNSLGWIAQDSLAVQAVMEIYAYESFASHYSAFDALCFKCVELRAMAQHWDGIQLQ